MIGRAIGVAGLTAAGLAHADAPAATSPRPAAPPPPAARAALIPAPPASGPPDSAVEDAAEANLESIENRKGMTLAFAIGGGLIAGFGIEDSVGRGGAFSLRLGRVATRHTVITVEFDGAVALHKQGMMSSTEANTNVDLLAGAQYYVNPSLWLRLGGGVGVYTARGILIGATVGERTTIGPAVIGGIGVDLARFKWAVLGIEGSTSAMINGGVLLGSSLKVGLSLD